jgi:hypothetical protein
MSGKIFSKIVDTAKSKAGSLVKNTVDELLGTNQFGVPNGYPGDSFYLGLSVIEFSIKAFRQAKLSNSLEDKIHSEEFKRLGKNIVPYLRKIYSNINFLLSKESEKLGLFKRLKIFLGFSRTSREKYKSNKSVENLIKTVDYSEEYNKEINSKKLNVCNECSKGKLKSKFDSKKVSEIKELLSLFSNNNTIQTILLKLNNEIEIINVGYRRDKNKAIGELEKLKNKANDFINDCGQFETKIKTEQNKLKSLKKSKDKDEDKEALKGIINHLKEHMKENEIVKKKEISEIVVTCIKNSNEISLFDKVKWPFSFSEPFESYFGISPDKFNSLIRSSKWLENTSILSEKFNKLEEENGIKKVINENKQEILKFVESESKKFESRKVFLEKAGLLKSGKIDETKLGEYKRNLNNIQSVNKPKDGKEKIKIEKYWSERVKNTNKHKNEILNNIDKSIEILRNFLNTCPVNSIFDKLTNGLKKDKNTDIWQAAATINFFMGNTKKDIGSLIIFQKNSDNTETVKISSALKTGKKDDLKKIYSVKRT